MFLGLQPTSLDYLPSPISSSFAQNKSSFSKESGADASLEGTYDLFTLRNRVYSDSCTSMADRRQVVNYKSDVTKTFPFSMINEAMAQFEIQSPVVVDWIRLLYTLSTSTIFIIMLALLFYFYMYE